MVKLQQFYQLKFSSDRLKKAKYNINITVDEARINSEVISVNNSELVRALFRLKNIEFSQKNINELLFLRKKLKKMENSEENRRKLFEINEKIENILFLNDFISIEFENKAHYLEILKKKGFYVNGTRYTPFMASAGMIRRNTALFINNNIKHQLMDVLENGRNEFEKVVPAKLGAYFSLYSSSTLPVSFPNFAIVPDKEIETIRKVDFVSYKGINEDDDVIETDYNVKANAWDGQGIITPRLAQKWSEELEMDYTFCNCVIRAPFLKGMVTVFDLDLFAKEVANKYIFTDIYGIERDIRDVDLIVSESMFKLWSSYSSTEDYIQKCNSNQLGFSIARINPKKEKTYAKTSYQFLQVLNLSDIDIAKLCEPTLEWFRNVSGNSAEDMILYATGEHSFEPRDFEKADITTKAIMLNPALAKDKYIQSKFIKTIEKKKKESYMGNLIVNGNYQFMISDPYYQACHIFKLENEKPLLNDKEHYSQYWSKKGLNKVVAVRSPIVHHSEVNILNLQYNEKINYWYKYMYSGIVFPANGIGMDCAIHGGSDVDGDIICTINSEAMMNGKIDGNIIMYESKKAEKKITDLRNDKEQVESQLLGYNSKVGFATNISSSLYSLLEEFPKGSLEHETILKRLKIGRVIQGEIIDGVKGLEVPPFREHWTKWKKITEYMPKEEKEKQEFYNRILCEVRPSFFRFLYPHYMSKYNKELKKYNLFSHLKMEKDFINVMQNQNKSEDEEQLVKSHKWNSFFLDNNSVVNKISRYMRTNVGLIGKFSNKSTKEFNYKLLMQKEFIKDSYKLAEMKKYLHQYKSFKKGLWHDQENSINNIDSFISYLVKECEKTISSNEAELASYAVLATYAEEVSMVDFPWRLFPSGLLQNIIENSNETIKIPIAEDNGEIEYLWNKYNIKEYKLEDLYAI